MDPGHSIWISYIKNPAMETAGYCEDDDNCKKDIYTIYIWSKNQKEEDHRIYSSRHSRTTGHTRQPWNRGAGLQGNPGTNFDFPHCSRSPFPHFSCNFFDSVCQRKWLFLKASPAKFSQRKGHVLIATNFCKTSAQLGCQKNLFLLFVVLKPNVTKLHFNFI